MKYDDITPTPGIELMDRKMAVRYFSERAKKIAADLATLPPSQRLIAAGEMLDAGVEAKTCVDIARWAIKEIESAASGGRR